MSALLFLASDQGADAAVRTLINTNDTWIIVTLVTMAFLQMAFSYLMLERIRAERKTLEKNLRSQGPPAATP